MNKIDLIIDALELAIKETQHPSLCIDKFDEALAAARELKAELAKPEQTYDHESDAMSVLADVNADLIQDAKPEPVNRSWLSKGNPANAPVRNSGAPPKPEQEPVRWFQQFGDAPPRKPWVGLTGIEVRRLKDIHIPLYSTPTIDDYLNFYRAIENELIDKNTT